MLVSLTVVLCYKRDRDPERMHFPSPVFAETLANYRPMDSLAGHIHNEDCDHGGAGFAPEAVPRTYQKMEVTIVILLLNEIRTTQTTGKVHLNGEGRLARGEMSCRLLCKLSSRMNCVDDDLLIRSGC